MSNIFANYSAMNVIISGRRGGISGVLYKKSQNLIFFIWLLGASRYAQNTRTGSRNIFHTRPAHSQKLPKIICVQLIQIVDRKPIYVSCKHPRGAFFLQKKKSWPSENLYVSCKHPRGAFFPPKQQGCLSKNLYVSCKHPRGAFFSPKNRVAL